LLTQIDAVYGAEIDAPVWSSTTAYFAYQQVTHVGVTYIALRANTNKTPGAVGSQLDWAPSRKSLELPILGVTTKASLLVRKVTGLNPPDVDLFIGDYARDGGTYQGRRVGSRNVVMTLDLNPNPALGETVSSLRELLYKTFIDPLINADYIELLLHDEAGNIRNLAGYTEKFETEIFDIETMAQISMICPDPYIRDLNETVLNNPSSAWVSVPFNYVGTAETGFEAEINVSNATSSLNLKNNGQAMLITASLVSGDVVYINTNRGYRDIRKATLTAVNAMKAAYPYENLSRIWTRLVNAGSTTPLIANLNPVSRWLELHSQTNTMNVHGAGPEDLVAGVKNLVYRASYWGV
jgi:hypothetical protein